MITKTQRLNAQRIVALADAFGRLPYNASGQTPEGVLNLSIPCARLVVAGIVTGVDPETNGGINDAAVSHVERVCRLAVEYATAKHGRGWWNEKAEAIL